MQCPQRDFSVELFTFLSHLFYLVIKKAVSIDFTFVYILVLTTQKVIN